MKNKHLDGEIWGRLRSPIFSDRKFRELSVAHYHAAIGN